MNIKIDNSSYYLSSLLVEKSKHRKTLLEDYITLNTASQNPAGASIFYNNLEYIAMTAGVEEEGRYNQVFYSPFDYKCNNLTSRIGILTGHRMNLQICYIMP